MDFLNSDDSDKDFDFVPEKYDDDLLSSEEDEHLVKRKNKVSKVDSPLSDVIELNDQAAEVAEDESTHANEEEILVDHDE